MNKAIAFISAIICLLLWSCKREVHFYFNIDSQALYMDKGAFYNLNIENDSITPGGKASEGAISLYWTDSTKSPPQIIYLDKIAMGYSVYRGGIESRERAIRLRGNSVYTITSTGITAVGCSIKVWTNPQGKVTNVSKIPQLGRANGNQ